MKKHSISLRNRLLVGLTASVIAFCPASPLFADDHGGGEGGDDGGGQHGGGGDDASKTEFLGTIQTLPGTAGMIGAWTVDGHAVNVSANTDIRTEHGAPAVGGKVEVEGPTLADGSVQATRIKTEDAEMEREDNVFFGPVQALPTAGVVGTWQIGGLTVLVSDATQVESEGGAPVVGSLVRVEGVQQPDASIVASEIQVQSDAVASAQAAAAKVKLQGTIEQLPGTAGSKGNWVIDGVVVTVSDDSKHVEGSRKAKAGRHVVIKGAWQVNGSIVARRIKVEGKTK